MAKTVDRLTAKKVEREHARRKPTLLYDGRGLYLRKQTSNGKASKSTWTVRYAYAGQQAWIAVGTYPGVSLSDARDEAERVNGLVSKGQNPAKEKRERMAREKAEAAGDGTFGRLAERWYTAEVENRREPLKHPEIPRRYLDKHILPALRTTPVTKVTAADIEAILHRVRRKHPAAANDVLHFVRRVFAYGVRRQLLVGDPAATLTPRLDAGGVEKPRSRRLNRDELTALFKAMRDTPAFSGLNVLAVKLLLALCVRKGELLQAKWSEFDLDGDTDTGPVWHLPAVRTKTGAALDIPLAPPVVKWLRALEAAAAGSEFVFPARRRDPRSRAQHVGRDTLNAALAGVKHKLDPFTVHDLRRSARSLLAELGVRREVAERCLGHKVEGIEGVYDLHDYFDERQAALTQLANLLVQIERADSKVTPIRGKRRVAG